MEINRGGFLTNLLVCLWFGCATHSPGLARSSFWCCLVTLSIQQYDSCHHRTTSSVVALLWSLLFVACESFILHSATAVRACALPTSTTASTLSLLLLLLLLVLASVPSRDLRRKQNEIHSRPLMPCHAAPRPDHVSRNPMCLFVCVISSIYIPGRFPLSPSHLPWATQCVWNRIPSPVFQILAKQSFSEFVTRQTGRRQIDVRAQG
jgi:hypothetical protein